MKKIMKKFNRKKTINFSFIFLIFFVVVASRYIYVKKIYHKFYRGTIQTKEVNIYSLETGKIQKIFFSENDVICKNDLLIQLDSSLIDNNIKQVEASIELEKTKESLLKFKQDKVLEEYLSYKKDKNQNSNNANSKLKLYESLELERNFELKKIAKLEADLKVYKDKKNNLLIYSPCNGKIQNVNININQNVRSKDKLLTISDSDNIWLIAKLHFNKSLNLKIGDNFFIQIEDYPDKKFQGKIFSISNIYKKKSISYVDVKVSVNQIKLNANETSLFPKNGMKAHLKYD